MTPEKKFYIVLITKGGIRKGARLAGLFGLFVGKEVGNKGKKDVSVRKVAMW